MEGRIKRPGQEQLWRMFGVSINSGGRLRRLLTAPVHSIGLEAPVLTPAGRRGAVEGCGTPRLGLLITTQEYKMSKLT